jgi:diacylglycerol kinase
LPFRGETFQWGGVFRRQAGRIHLDESSGGYASVARFEHKPDGWSGKFARAARGAGWALGAERNFAVHVPAALAVSVLAALVRVRLAEWCLLVLCIAMVLSAELFNTAVERLARAVTGEENEEIRNALDAAAGAVLVASIGAAIVGAIVLVARLAILLGWWN